ncbi:hypothetical protein, partial [Pseudomonas sp. HAR-UPW-AIA-41]|uniref:hypothetical protein n=1 Tax=Pseudomonas sp. HAR-UPW-AIA-41 TaxID=1985301 RepID=UPI001C447E01
KPEIYVGALVSLLQSYSIIEAKDSNAALAKRLGTTAASLSKREYLQEEGIEELHQQTAVLLWNLYCQKENPTIRKPEIYVGALVSLLQSYSIIEAKDSNAALAKRLG